MSNEFQKDKSNLIEIFTPGFIHDVRNSLSVLKLNYYFLDLKDESIPPEIAASLADCTEAIKRIEKKLNDFSLLTAQNDSSGEICEPNEIFSAAIEISQVKAKKNYISYKKKFENNLPSIKINKNVFLQFLLNIINTIIDFGLPKHELVFKTFKNDSGKIGLEIVKAKNLNKKKYEAETEKKFIDKINFNINLYQKF
ncbi:MAG: hypothetical protein ABI550_09025, partial [Ignavibacteriaceae bacterium]